MLSPTSTVSDSFLPSSAFLFRRMFETAPDDWSTFSFTEDDVENKSDKFLEFAKRFVKMLDLSVHMLGPDMEIVQEQLYDLGAAHERYGVTPKHYELMGKALVYTLSTVLGRRSCTEATKDSWEKIYTFITATMMEGASSA